MDLSVQYRGPDGMSQQLWDEVKSRYGTRAQNKGFVTGYMDAARAGQTGGHFADRYGITHAVDIGVDIESDGTGLLPKDALALAEHLRVLGASGKHPFSKRGYLIHDLSTTTTPAPRIAGFHTGWKWQVYGGASPHSDHIHVTTGGDQQWGAPPQLDPSVSGSRQSWGVTNLSKTGGDAVSGSMRPAPEMYPITQRYRQNATAFNAAGMHGALDYGVPPGTPLVAPDDGVVIFDGWAWDLPGGPNDWHLRWYLIKPARGDTKGGGGIITIFRNSAGSYWGLAHASQSFFNVGDRVKAGQVIQNSGNTGISTGPHSHVNLWPANPNWANGAFGAIDPEPWITRPYSPLTYTSWQGSPTTGQGATTKKKDWFDMATEADLRRIVREEIRKNVRHAEFVDTNGKTQTFNQIWAFRTGKAENLLSAIAAAVKPSTIAAAIWSYKNAKVNGTRDTYQVLTDASTTTEIIK